MFARVLTSRPVGQAVTFGGELLLLLLLVWLLLLLVLLELLQLELIFPLLSVRLLRAALRPAAAPQAFSSVKTSVKNLKQSHYLADFLFHTENIFKFFTGRLSSFLC